MILEYELGRDSSHIIGSTTTSLPNLGPCAAGGGCIPPVTGIIDSFLPITYPDDLHSDVYPIALGHDFRDFSYPIDSTFKWVTFAFASTAAVEVIGIDSVSITGDFIAPVPEPSAMLLLSVGLIGIAGARRRAGAI
jgi:hypothetical protein